MPEVSLPIAITMSKMPLSRRRRSHFSTLPQSNEIQVEGEAHLCFAEDYSWFQGSVNTEDESNYSVYGDRVDCHESSKVNGIKPVGELNNNVIKDDKESTKEYNEEVVADEPAQCYCVKLTDHFLGTTYSLPRVQINRKAMTENGTSSSFLFCSDDEAKISFQVQNVFKGQKADMLIQRYLGSSLFVGRKCVVYSGIISLLINDELGIPGRNCWSL